MGVGVRISLESWVCTYSPLLEAQAQCRHKSRLNPEIANPESQLNSSPKPKFHVVLACRSCLYIRLGEPQPV